MALSAVALAASQATPVRTFEAGGNRIAAEGVCDVSATSVTCWDLDGRPLPALEKLLKAELEREPSLSSRADARKKSRIMAASTDPAGTIYFSGHHEDEVYEVPPSLTESGRLMHWFQTNQEQTTATMNLKVVVDQLSGAPATEISMKPGSKATYDGESYEMGHWAKTEVGRDGRPQWRLVLGAPVEEGKWFDAPQFTPLGSTRKEIDFVDSHGVPQPTHGSGGKTWVPTFAVSERGDHAMSVVTDIDPSTIAYVKMYRPRKVEADLGPFLLDPVPIR